ncbi:Phage tail assembly [Lactococcus cremoris subsp. cremoris A76]|uniref:Phage tail assembly n=1 Tax=Lactococcus lactis subsp. cremoris TaxID=1359 RepID=UPI000238D2BF|nr:Phage tail assembly [Lactococcus cremoris]AEU41303.1 Phage tail assembly [Lactococcus cremoris subsp. cremoris A76]
MLINVLNGSLKKVAILSNELPNAPSYYNDEFHDYLEQGATTFSFTVAKVINNQLQDYTQFLSDQSYFSFRKNGRDYLMTPSSSQAVRETSTEISFVCVSLDRELINEQANSLTNTASHNIQWYFDRMGLISRTKITIGINEVSNLTRVINYDAQEPKLSRLISVINNFNAEFDFVTTLNNDGSLGTVVLNIYKENDGQNAQGVGTKRDDVRLIFGKNIEDVEVEVSDDGFFNAAYMTGADGFSWKNYAFSYKNSDGVEEFYKRKGSEIAYAPLSAKMFPSQLKTDKGDIWTSSDRTTEYKNANDMWGYIVSQFKQYAYKKITYTVTPSSTLVNQLVGDGRPLRKGDTVIIQDDNYMDIDGNVGLILSARVSEIITSDTKPANNKIVFSNYKKLKSEASVDIQAIVSQLVNDATPYFADIATSNGVQFKNGTGSTTLSAHIYKGSATAETIADSYEWSKDGTVVAPTQTITVDASGVSDKAVYSFKATVGGKVVASQSVTITNVNDGAKGAQGPQGPQGLKGDPGATGIPGQAGADGKTSYLHIAYATNSTGTAGFDVSNATGKTYIGQYTDFTSADSTDPSKYTWSLIKGDKGDKGDQGVQGIQGLQGPAGTQGVAGPKGADGKTQYTHIAYANSADGVTNFSTSDSNRTYIGMYVDFNINDSTTPSNYSWTLVKGADGTQGTPGKPGTDGKTPYFHTAWSYSADGTDGFATVCPNLNLLDGTKDFSGVWTNSSYWETDGTYKGLTVKKRTGQWSGINKSFIAQEEGNYTFSAYVKSSGGNANITRFCILNTFGVDDLRKRLGNNFDWTRDSFTIKLKAGDEVCVRCEIDGSGADSILWTAGHKWEEGSTATPYMTSSSEVTTADWPSYIGQYTDFTQADSTKSTDYVWSLIRGNDGKDGATGPQGPTGPAGSNGNPGKVVSDTEPSTRFKGLTWKYSGPSDLTASDGTVIKPNTEYYYNGTHWMINYLSANNLEANSITADLIDAKNLKITDGEFVSTTTNGSVKIHSEIKDDHLQINKTDTSTNSFNAIELESDSGLTMTHLNSYTGENTISGVNYQGLFMRNSLTNEFARLTPQGTKLSTDVPWTTLSATGGFRDGSIQFSVQNGVAYFSVTNLITPAMTDNKWYQCAQLPTSSSAIPSVNRVTTAFSNASIWGFYVATTGGLYFKSFTGVSVTNNSTNVLAAFPIG